MVVCHSTSTRNIVLITVVVGRLTNPPFTKEVPQVIARAVPSSTNWNSTMSPLFGAPDKFVVIEVIAALIPVNICISTLSVAVVGLAPGAFTVTARRVTLLLVSVSVLVLPTSVWADEGNVITFPLPLRVLVLNTGADESVCTPVKVCAASVQAIVADVVGNVIVVASVPARVRVFDTDNFLPEATTSATYQNDHEAVPVPPAVLIQVTYAEVLPARTTREFAPDVCMVTAPVLLFTIKNCCPFTSVVATGNVTVWVVLPVKYCWYVLPTTSVVVPAAVAIVV